ncbi:hypothetical protein O7632_03760 [Solwaraspora sp. WMMD406]|uniref:hypothetical protein n=1 Tax=Solwaraspora sp. WMMD406 TaxID=3016095 RepID=UPI002416B4ED|nr:hypothetical protein [Solwaraspora sp. WMMD406]MDG4763229.1 hypothetical protein [Solwaraspora sp. WMMD406]
MATWMTPGMPVVDATGHTVGTVGLVRAPDANAVTVEGDVDAEDEIGPDLPHPQTGDEPATSPDVAARLLRTGFVKIHTAVPGAAGYVGLDQISAVDTTTVRLAVAWSEVTRRG